MFELADPPMFDPGGVDEMGRPVTAEAVQASITEGAGQIAAATSRWLGAVSELERRGLWAGLQCRSAAHWICWQCGVDPAAAREMVKVAVRLRELPHISLSFSKGELSYFQVRALVKVATPEIEEFLLDIARYATCGQLERLTRAYRRVLETQAPGQTTSFPTPPGGATCAGTSTRTGFWSCGHGFAPRREELSRKPSRP